VGEFGGHRRKGKGCVGWGDNSGSVHLLLTMNPYLLHGLVERCSHVS